MGRVLGGMRHVWMGRVLRECEECVEGEGVGGCKDVLVGRVWGV